jgi:hypothetical protein
MKHKISAKSVWRPIFAGIASVMIMAFSLPASTANYDGGGGGGTSCTRHFWGYGTKSWCDEVRMYGQYDSFEYPITQCQVYRSGWYYWGNVYGYYYIQTDGRGACSD